VGIESYDAVPLDSSEFREIQFSENHTLRQSIQEILPLYYQFSSNLRRKYPEKSLILCEYREIQCSNSPILISGAY